MATSTRIVFIGLGVPTIASSSLVLFDSGQAGTLGAQRILTHPDGVNFAPINYYKNPTRTFNLDNEVLPAPITESVLTLSSRKVIRFERTLEDVVVTEVWEGAEGSEASMPTFLFRQLYEYLRNPPPFDTDAQTYITWQPRDRTLKVYNVQFYRLTVGGGSDEEQVFDIDDRRLPDSVQIAHPLESLDVSPTGLITRNVEVKLRVHSEAA
jgi:hypothetical protein